MRVCTRADHTQTLYSAISLLSIYITDMHAYIQQMAYKNVNCSIIYNIPELETAQIPNSRVDTQIRVYSFIQYNNMQE